MFICLSATDRERYGCPEWIELAFDRLSAREAATLQRETGLTPTEIVGALQPRVEVRDGGRWVAIDLKDGESAPEGARVVTDYDAWAGVIWVALRRAGCDVTFDQASDFDVFGFTSRSDVVSDQGKGGVDQSTPATTSEG